MFLDETQVTRLLTMEMTLEAVELAFAEKAKGRTQMPPQPYLFLEDHHGDLRVMPAYVKSLDICGVKIVNAHPLNPKRRSRMRSVYASGVLIDPETGYTICFMDFTFITRMRTGAAAGIATRYLARDDAKVLALVGAGAQASAQVEGVRAVRDITEVRVVDAVRSRAVGFSREQSARTGLKFTAVKSIQECVRDADVICSLTPVRKPIIKAEWIKPGVHINAMGADAPGKQEIDPRVLEKARIFVDDWEQARHSGEINVTLKQGILKKRNIRGEIGEVLTGKVKGRTDSRQITIFDSTGLAIQDVVTGHAVFNAARKRHVGKALRLNP